MLFNKNNANSNDRVIYQTKPHMLLGCKKAVYGIVFLAIILIISPIAIKFIGEMQVYLISQIKLSLTRYVAIAFFVIIFIDIIYIIWQLVEWNSTEYMLTNFKIIVKSGVLSTKKNYMPYTTIQDVNTTQNIFAKIFNVGTVSVFSAYDNNEMELKNIFNPSEVEEILFSKIMEARNIPMSQPRNFSQNRSYYHNDEEYYDEFEPITPIDYENSYQRRNYEYYPENSEVNRNRHNYNYYPENSEVNRNHHNYEYEPYDNEYVRSSNSYNQDNYYNEIRDEYAYVDDDYYSDDTSEIYYNDGVDEFTQDGEEIDSSSQDVIKRHFDKFKK